MATIAIIGAGPRLGLSIGKVFGRKGFNVALIARNETKLAGHADELRTEGIDAAGFAADTTDRPALVAAIDRAAAHFGGIEVLEYSPTPPDAFTSVYEVTAAKLQPQLDCLCHGAVAATNAVLPAMLAAGSGTLLFTTGASSIKPNQMFGAAGIAAAGLRNWALNLNGALADKGVYAGHVAIGVWIGDTPGPADAARQEPDDLAGVYWELHTRRDEAELLIT